MGAPGGFCRERAEWTNVERRLHLGSAETAAPEVQHALLKRCHTLLLMELLCFPLSSLKPPLQARVRQQMDQNMHTHEKVPRTLSRGPISCRPAAASPRPSETLR